LALRSLSGAQVRLYAQDAKAKKQAVKAPVSVRGTAGRFAMRFFEEAYTRESDNGVVRLEKELAVLEWSVRGQASWKVQTTSPFYDLQWKRELISKRVNALGLSPLILDLVMQLVAKGEVRRLRQIRTDYDEIMRGYRREVDVKLTTAAPVSTERLDLLKRSIQVDYLKPEDNLIFAHVVDESIVGGYKVNVKGQEHDHSWAASVRETDEQASRIASAPRDALSKAPRTVTLNLSEAIKSVVSDKESQGWIGPDLFARAQAQEDERAAIKVDGNRLKVLQAIKATRAKNQATS